MKRWMASLTLRGEGGAAGDDSVQWSSILRLGRRETKFVNLRFSREHIGGLILVNVADNGRVVAKADPLQTASFINRMQRLAKVPLSGGRRLPSAELRMRLESTTVFPHAMAFAASGDPEEARIEGEITAKESRAMGFSVGVLSGCGCEQQSG